MASRLRPDRVLSRSLRLVRQVVIRQQRPRSRQSSDDEGSCFVILVCRLSGRPPFQRFQVLAICEGHEMAFDHRLRLLELLVIGRADGNIQAILVGMKKSGTACKSALSVTFSVDHLDLMAEVLAQLSQIFLRLRCLPARI
ncbi:protein of unknown function (plasmid) [Pseudorhizobium banfieldiae]|uniref:Uncharacterized protein n=1 Tax=Pseudorhizobium banfieldiae TaxID=1125847 RepID=L0NM66_9HYPH|nr:protein of unknown function [Pseudorhizobium banfieldiae]